MHARLGVGGAGEVGGDGEGVVGAELTGWNYSQSALLRLCI